MGSEAARLHLKAMGKQDTYLLSKDPEQTFFNYQKIKQHSEFRKFHRSKNVLNPGQIVGWPFSQTVKVEFDPKNMGGDLLTNLYLKIELPAKETANVNYTTPLGRGFLKSIAMFVDDIVVEEITDDWQMIHESLYLDPQSKKGNLVLLNMSESVTPGIKLSDATMAPSNRFIVPLPFFFCRKYGKTEMREEVEDRQYFPTCAVHKQKIQFELTFHPQTWWQGAENGHTPTTITVNNFQLITEQIKLSDEERLYLVGADHSILVNVVKKHTSFTTAPESDRTFKVNLEPKSKVKTFHWFFRDKLYTTQDQSSHRYVTYVRSRAPLYQWNAGVLQPPTMETRNTPIMKKARFFLNGESFPNTLMEGHEHYKYAVPYKFGLGVTDDTVNIYTQSFALHPLLEQSTGTLDFANLNADRTLIEFEINKFLPNAAQDVEGAPGLDQPFSGEFELHLYYLEMQKLDFSRGFMTFAGASPPIAAPTAAPQPDEYVMPSGPLGGRPRPSGAGVQAY